MRTLTLTFSDCSYDAIPEGFSFLPLFCNLRDLVLFVFRSWPHNGVFQMSLHPNLTYIECLLLTNSIIFSSFSCIYEQNGRNVAFSLWAGAVRHQETDLGRRHKTWHLPALVPRYFPTGAPATSLTLSAVSGFYFSTSEPTALEQSEGGPCAIIAPVQAFILKNLLLKYKDLSFRDKVQLEIGRIGDW